MIEAHPDLLPELEQELAKLQAEENERVPLWRSDTERSDASIWCGTDLSISSCATPRSSAGNPADSPCGTRKADGAPALKTATSC